MGNVLNLFLPISSHFFCFSITMDDSAVKNIFTKSPCEHQLKSFNWMCDEGINTFIESLNPWKVPGEREADDGNLYIKLNRIAEPTIEPHEARMYDKNYTCEVIVNVKYEKESKVEELDNISIGNIPCLLRSQQCLVADKSKQWNECPHDEGGYFIIDGKEKAIVSRERIVPNQLFLNKEIDDKGHMVAKAECRAVPLLDSLFPKVIRFSLQQIEFTNKSKPTHKYHRSQHVDSNVVSATTVFELNVSCAAGKMPLFVLFRALSVESDKDILSYIFDQDEIEDHTYLKLIHDLVVGSKDARGNMIYTRQGALDFIFSHNTHRKLDTLLDTVYPNVQTSKEKAVMLGLHAREVIRKYFEPQHESTWSENRDNFRQKRVDVCGVLLLQVFRDAYNRMRNSIISKLKRKSSDDIPLERFFQKNTFIDEAMIASFKGNWGLLNDPAKSGIVEDLDRLSYTSYISHIRRVKSPVDSSLKLTDPHKLGTEQFGFFCPFESPDGANIGLIKHLASGCVITSETSPDEVIKILRLDKNFIDMSRYSPYQNTAKIFLNNSIYGQHVDPISLYGNLLVERRKGAINSEITFYLSISSNEFHIFTDSGRCIRPLLIAENVAETLQAAKQGNPITYGLSYEYVELSESNHHLIAKEISDITKYTRYCEIDPSLCLGYYMSSVPFLNHNPSARAMLSGQQAKQAIGVYSTNFRRRFDTLGYVLNYPQKNLITTMNSGAIKKNAIPNGENVIMAIAAMGYNQEDAVILNRNSVERGMFNVSAFKTMTTTISSGDSVHSSFANLKHEKQQGRYLEVKYKNLDDDSSYDKIDSAGFPIKNQKYDDGDIIVGKITKKYSGETSIDAPHNHVVKDTPVKATSKYCGYVDDLFYSDSKLKIRLRQTRIPTLGDKVASMHGQKGVVGMLIPQEDMPFSKDGLIPDVVINPYAFPKRMTIGHVLECLFGRAAARAGNQIDASAFQKYDLEKISDFLEKKSMHRSSNELLYNPRTGHQMNAEIFIGPMYYYRLKHMVADKINYRGAVGGVDALTGQPAKGRARNGGLKIGEMEMSSILAHGSATFLKEAIVDKSDGVIRQPGKTENVKTQHAYLDSHGDIIVSNYDKKLFLTQNVTPDVSAVRLPKSFQLMQNELRSACINMQLKTSPVDEDLKGYLMDDSDDESLGLAEEQEQEQELSSVDRDMHVMSAEF